MAQQKKRRRPAVLHRFEWTPARHKAVRLCWDGYLSHPQIAAACGISTRQLSRWKAAPAFQARWRALGEAFRDEDAAASAHR